ncbi:galactokinase family protein, partial [Nocardia farcinica]|uniref:GHMP family kinase ATP-binding protein n=1 Tax=Nocardia farcinica TaxID=37329 RepID=UPI0024545B30
MVDTWVAPGRVNIIGEHTDYNDGYVLPIALPLVTRCAARVTAQPVVRVRSRQRPDEPVRAELDAIDAVRTQVPGWARYVLGVVGEFVRRGHPVGGLDLEVDGAVPIGAGLSSSAALSCSVALALRDLFAPQLSERELIDVARAAENDYAGAPTGVLDQSGGGGGGAQPRCRRAVVVPGKSASFPRVSRAARRGRAERENLWFCRQPCMD